MNKKHFGMAGAVLAGLRVLLLASCNLDLEDSSAAEVRVAVPGTWAVSSVGNVNVTVNELYF